MLEFTLPFRPNIVYGPNTIDKLEDYIYGSKILFVYGTGSIKQNQIYNKVIESLGDRSFIEYPNIGSNPKLSQIREAISAAKQFGVEQIIAVGGGSVIDAAKAIAIGAQTNDDIWDVYTKGIKINSAIDLLTVVTNVATGSETNDVSVIVNDQLKLKRSIKNPLIYPKVAIMDPTLLLTVSSYNTKYGLIDCFSHLFEQYFNNVNNHIIDAQIAGYMRNVIELAPKLLEDLKNLELRDQHMYLSYVAYNCDIRNMVGGDFASHGLDYGLASEFNTTHGAGLAIIMPNWLEYVSRYKPQKIARLGRDVFAIIEDDDQKCASLTVAAMRDWLRQIKAVSSYSELGITVRNEDLKEMCEKAKVSYPLGNYYGLDEKAILEIYEMGK